MDILTRVLTLFSTRIRASSKVAQHLASVCHMFASSVADAGTTATADMGSTPDVVTLTTTDVEKTMESGLVATEDAEEAPGSDLLARDLRSFRGLQKEVIRDVGRGGGGINNPILLLWSSSCPVLMEHGILLHFQQ